jgi:hypothetical protein
MNRRDLPAIWTRFMRKVREVGVKEALRQAGLRVLLRPTDGLPLARANSAGLFSIETDAIHAEEKERIRTTSLLYDASHVEATYPEVFSWRDRFMRYAFLPATGDSRGLVVLFHGHNAFLHLGPVGPLAQFDLLAPWDTFGWRRQGSWFWGEKGDDFVAEMVRALIRKQRTQAPVKPWFCMGSSMGGFGALYHGIKDRSDGIYVMCPQVDLIAKIEDYGGDAEANPYAYLCGKDQDSIPDLIELARNQDVLPPLYLIQNQYDHVNPFAEHAFKLLEVYNAKRAWYGLRVHPAIGHGGDGKQEEAELFFSLILDHDPPQRVATGGRAAR